MAGTGGIGNRFVQAAYLPIAVLLAFPVAAGLTIALVLYVSPVHGQSSLPDAPTGLTATDVAHDGVTLS